jgi:WD40 repeat protein
MADIYNMSDVFISYSRKDLVFVKRLFELLKGKGKEVWADFEDIPKAADWWQEIEAGINAANAFVFIISPDSVRSDVCRKELETAIAANKPLLPVLHRDIVEQPDKEKVHPAINAHNWIFFREADDFDGAFDTLLKSVETDLEHNRIMTRLLVRAREWEGGNRNASYLLRGEDLDQAHDWLTQALGKQPEPTTLHLEYIDISEKAQRTQQRRTLGFLTTGFVISLLLAVAALFMWNQSNIARAEAVQAQEDAVEAQQEAEVERDNAETAYRKARSLGLASSAHEALADNDPDLALTLALEAIAVDDTQPQILSSLADAVYSPGTYKVYDTNQTALNKVAYSPHDEIVATGTDRGVVCIWQVADGKQQRCLSDATTEDTSAIVGVAFAEDGMTLVTASSGGVTRSWDMNPESKTYGELLHSIACEPASEGLACQLRSMALSPDGETAVFGTDDGNIGVWNPQTGEFIRYLNREFITAPVNALAISPSGLRLMSGYEDGTVVHWYLNNDEVLGIMPSLTGSNIMSLAFQPGGQFGVSGDRDGLITLYDLTKAEAIRTFNEHEEAVTTLVYHPVRDVFYSSSWDNSIIEWNPNTGREIGIYYGHDGGVNTISLSHDGLKLVSGGFDTQIRIWSVLNFLTADRIRTNNSWINGLAYRPEADVYATAQQNGDVMVFDAAHNHLLRTYRGYGREAMDVALSQDGQYLATIYRDKRVMMRNLTTSRRMWTLKLDTVAKQEPHSVFFTQDGSQVVVVFFDGWAWFDTKTGEQIGNIAYGYDEAGKLTSVRALALHPNGKQAIVGLNSLTDNLRLVDFTTGEMIRSFVGHRDGVLSVAFNADGTQAISGSFDNTVRLWDVTTGRKLKRYNGHSDRVIAVAFSPDGTKIVSGGNDQTVRLWSTETGFQLYSYAGHTARVNEVIFSADGATMMSGGRDTELIIWRLPQSLDGMLVWAADNRFARTLSCSERNQYLGETNECEE